MAGETDLTLMLRTLEVDRRPGSFVYCVDAREEAVCAAAATVREAEGLTLVLPRERAQALGIAFEREWAWLTLRVHSALEAVGLTAAVARSLADVGLPCNVLAGAFHDHLLVPEDRSADAIAALARLRSVAS